jgi:hypothetical protein
METPQGSGKDQTALVGWAADNRKLIPPGKLADRMTRKSRALHAASRGHKTARVVTSSPADAWIFRPSFLRGKLSQNWFLDHAEAEIAQLLDI